MPTDEELIEKIKNGNQTAMEILVKKYYKAIFSYIYRKTGDYHTSYDLTQEVFVKMMKSIIHKYDGRGKFQNWLLKIAVNHCNDYFRSKSYKYKKTEVKYDQRLTDDNNKVWNLFNKKTERKTVKKAIMSLPNYQRDTLILRFYHDMKLKDIAEVTNSKEATVKSRLRQGMTKLKNILIGGEKHVERERKSQNL